MHRFLIPNQSLKASSINLSNKDEIHHLKNVLRLKEGQRVEIFNGVGDIAEARITAITAADVAFDILSFKNSSAQKQYMLSLACAIPKNAKFETIIEKTTELGIDEITPIITKRTEVVPKGEAAKKKHSRFKTIAINAVKQSKRATIPTIHPITAFSAFLGSVKPSDTLFIPCLTEKDHHITDQFKNIKLPSKIIFVIGPEGDFTPEEIKQAQSKGAQPLTLGSNVLKVDTAAISTIALAKFLLPV